MNRGLSMGYTAYIVLSPIGTLPRKVEPPIGDDEDADLEDFKFTRKVGKKHCYLQKYYSWSCHLRWGWFKRITGT
jgi:hypothetical protein